MTDLQISHAQFDKKKRNRKINKFLLPFVCATLLLFVIVMTISILKPTSSAKYNATVDLGSFNVVNPSTLTVTFHISNIGDAVGRPWCTLSVSDDSDTYTGRDYFQLAGSVNPQESVTSSDKLSIGKEGSQYVTKAQISCH